MDAKEIIEKNMVYDQGVKNIKLLHFFSLLFGWRHPAGRIFAVVIAGLLTAGCAGIAPHGYKEINKHITIDAPKDHASILIVAQYLTQVYGSDPLVTEMIGGSFPYDIWITRLNNKFTGWSGVYSIEVNPGDYTVFAGMRNGIAAPNVPFIAGENKVYVLACDGTRVWVRGVPEAVYSPTKLSFEFKGKQFKLK